MTNGKQVSKVYSDAEFAAFNQGKQAFIEQRLYGKKIICPFQENLAFAVAFQCGVVAEQNDHVLVTGEK